MPVLACCLKLIDALIHLRAYTYILYSISVHGIAMLKHDAPVVTCLGRKPLHCLPSFFRK